MDGSVSGDRITSQYVFFSEKEKVPGCKIGPYIALGFQTPGEKVFGPQKIPQTPEEVFGRLG